MMAKNKWAVLSGSILITMAVALLSTWFTQASVRDWYPTLEKPSWTPPSWIFGPVWIILYLCMAFSVWLVWKKRQIIPSATYEPYYWYSIQLFLNLIWSFLFFYLQSPFLGLVDIAFLWWAILMTMVSFWPYSRTGTLLLVPYLIWVTYALSLNLGILTLKSLIRTTSQF